jgi:hypothetical protein
MSKFDYDVSREIAAKDYPFYALIMAAYRKADTGNQLALELGFPGVIRELQARYDAPGGVLPTDPEAS